MYACVRFFRKESKLICIVCHTEGAELDEVFTISVCFKCCISYHWVFHLRSKDTVVCIATRLLAGHPKGAGYEVYLFTEPALGTTLPPLLGSYEGCFPICSVAGMRCRSPPPTVEVKIVWSCSSRPPYAFMVCIHTTIPLL